MNAYWRHDCLYPYPRWLLFILSLCFGVAGRGVCCWAAEIGQSTEIIYDGVLNPKWEDRGWAPRDTNLGKMARLNFTHHEGWILARPDLHGNFAALSFVLHAPADLGYFLEVHLASDSFDSFPRVVVDATVTKAGASGLTQALIPLKKLNPQALPFNQIIFGLSKSFKPKSNQTNEQQVVFNIDKIALLADPNQHFTVTDDSSGLRQAGKITIDCSAGKYKISPYIYGIAYNPQHNNAEQWLLRTPVRRWGGNATSRYNFRIGTAWNAASDWFFQNLNFTNDDTFSWVKFFDENAAHQATSAMTLPMLGWVAKDTQSYSYPVRVFGPQQATNAYNHDSGNGKKPDGTLLNNDNPRRTSIPAPPEFIGDWVKSIKAYAEDNHRNPVLMYFLDNEPSLWNSTHRDVHPQALSYDELLSRSISYAQQIRRNDAEAKIAGPCEWGWPSYFFSAVDAAAGFAAKPDRRKHNDIPYLAWYLQQMRAYELQHHEKLLNILDVHFYPQGQNIYGGKEGTNKEAAARRLRATRSLWDPNYQDESWIADKINLLPRLKALIADNYPGLQISIGEYNFGGETTISGALALAEALGHFGTEEVYSAFYWTAPPNKSKAMQAFLAYRDYDGQGSSFPENGVGVHTSPNLSAFAAKDHDGRRLVVILANTHEQAVQDTTITLNGCGDMVGGRHFHLTEAMETLALDPTPLQQHGLSKISEAVPPMSLNVLELQISPSSP